MWQSSLLVKCMTSHMEFFPCNSLGGVSLLRDISKGSPFEKCLPIPQWSGAVQKQSIYFFYADAKKLTEKILNGNNNGGEKTSSAFEKQKKKSEYISLLSVCSLKDFLRFTLILTAPQKTASILNSACYAASLQLFKATLKLEFGATLFT